MNNQRDLLPWILGGLSAAAVAVAVTALSISRTEDANPPPARVLAARATTRALAAPVPVSMPIAAASPQALPQPKQAAMLPAVRDSVPVTAGQIWQCMTNGVKTFSNNPCGEKSSLLDVGPINTMPPPPVMNYARSYAPQPRYVQASDDQSDEGDQDAYADEPASETGGNAYTIVQGIRIERRRRADHTHRPPAHRNSAQVSRKY